MIEQLNDMPDGTIGFRATGKITADDYREVLEPTIRSAIGSGEIRMLYMLEGDFEITPAASLQDARTGLTAYTHHAAWKKTAIVTDAGWLVKSLHAFAWMVPGAIEVFPIADFDRAKDWLTADAGS